MRPVPVRPLLVRGLLAGLAAGLLALVVAYLLGEPQMNAAISFEDAHTHEHGAEVVSRSLQSTAGLATGVLAEALALGGLASLAYCALLGRTGRFGPRATAALLSGAALLAVHVIPFLKYPANPPSVGEPDTIGTRTTLYVLMIALSALLCAGAVLLGRRLSPRLGPWHATVAAAAALLSAIALAYALLPPVDEVPADFPADLLWRFRLAALAVPCTLWAAFGVFFGGAAERLVGAGEPSAPAVTPDGAGHS
ncbi:CbtA family protein [Streptomyces sp. AV19]|uniref:CbtA family protein n=1 Tax=Streptomyces sp. AV19 TaxID=2793068 RepID=UPI0018FE8DE1|nr:CbtA family protein [Streptomyces sp. AV19]MBH1938801.1 CbtA family protein [Streptomyces sp. AV19]MDG4534734.1 CbtA family protein [Streptomyces sp. AV19]